VIELLAIIYTLISYWIWRDDHIAGYMVGAFFFACLIRKSYPENKILSAKQVPMYICLTFWAAILVLNFCRSIHEGLNIAFWVAVCLLVQGKWKWFWGNA
jgi:hypothetical protein